MLQSINCAVFKGKDGRQHYSWLRVWWRVSWIDKSISHVSEICDIDTVCVIPEFGITLWSEWCFTRFVCFNKVLKCLKKYWGRMYENHRRSIVYGECCVKANPRTTETCQGNHKQRPRRKQSWRMLNLMLKQHWVTFLF